MKKIENKLNKKSSSHKFISGIGGEKLFLLNICCILLLLIYLFFLLFIFVCVCVTNFCGSLVILFWGELIKNKVIITKKTVNTRDLFP